MIATVLGHPASPPPSGPPRVTRELRAEAYRVELDLSPQVLSLSIPEKDTGFSTSTGEVPLAPTCRDLGRGFVSASMLAVKAKLFDDGLYAAVELAAQNGAGRLAGKAKLLARLVGEAPQIAAAASLGGLDAPLDQEARGVRARFLADELAAKPIGFYTWSEELRRIFQQDRLLQQELPVAHAEALATALRGDPSLTTSYASYLDLVARLTNPLVKPDLRRAQGRYFFPPSRAHETDLIERLYGDTQIPEGFSLAEEMIRRIRAGSLSLQPTSDSGWYGWQTWALEPLVVPEKMAEAPRLRLDARYRRQLEELFKAVIALTRETHVKQLVVPMVGAAGGGKQAEIRVWVRPELTVEPLVTYYERRAAAYDFVRGVLESAFGPDALKSMRRVMSTGTASTPLDQELEDTTALFRGAAAVASQELGIAASEGGPAARFRAWAQRDPEIAGDIRMMVPVFYDILREKLKVWAVLGWSTRKLFVAFATPPQARILEGRVRLEFIGEERSLVYPVFAEVFVSRLLDRDEFRAHCDRYRTRREILAHL